LIVKEMAVRVSVAARQGLLCLLFVSLCCLGSDAHQRSLLQSEKSKPAKEKQPKQQKQVGQPGGPPGWRGNVDFNAKDAITGEPAPPTGKKRFFKSDGDAKQFLSQLGPEMTEQVLLRARNLGADTPEEGAARLEDLLASSDDVVSHYAHNARQCCNAVLL
jgi:hypothetical protein